MTDSERYANHYLKQLAGNASDNGRVEMSEMVQSGGVGLGTSNSITSRYLIPASINSKKSVVSVDVHGPGRNLENSVIKIRKTKGKKPKKRRKKSNNVQRGGKRGTAKKSKKKKTRSRVYKGGGISRPSKRKIGRFDNLRDNF